MNELMVGVSHTSVKDSKGLPIQWPQFYLNYPKPYEKSLKITIPMGYYH